MKQAIGIDIGATKIWAAAIAEDGRILAEERIPTPQDSAELLTGTIAAISKTLHARFPGEGIGIGVPGPADSISGEVFKFTNLDIAGFNLRDRLSKATEMPVFLDNDANLAALGESRYGAGRNYKDFVMLTIGTGIGGGIIVDNRIYRGPHGGAAELGHMSINAKITDQPTNEPTSQPTWGGECPCGSYGCLERFASGEAIALRARELLQDYPDSFLAQGLRSESSEAGEALKGSEIATSATPPRNDERTTGQPANQPSSENITGKEVTEAARRGDALALKVFSDVSLALGAGMANLINIFDPEAIIIGGGVTDVAGDLFLEQAEKQALDLALNKNIKIIRAELGNQAGVLGAAAHFFV